MDFLHILHLHIPFLRILHIFHPAFLHIPHPNGHHRQGSVDHHHLVQVRALVLTNNWNRLLLSRHLEVASLHRHGELLPPHPIMIPITTTLQQRPHDLPENPRATIFWMSPKAEIDLNPIPFRFPLNAFPL